MEKGLKRPLFVGEPLTPEKRHKVNVDHVQITAPTEEVDSRIQAFVASKRELNNQSNRREFRSLDPDILEKSCAREDAQSLNREHQIRRYAVQNDDPIDILGEHFDGVSERLDNLDNYVFDTENPPPVSKDIYERLKNLEDRILALEQKGALPYQQTLPPAPEKPKKRRKKSTQTKSKQKKQAIKPIDNFDDLTTEKLDSEIASLKATLASKARNKKNNLTTTTTTTK